MSDFYDRIAFARIWPWLLAVAVVFFAAVQIFRVNVAHENANNATGDPTPFPWTRGAVFSGIQTVPAGRFLAARIDLNHRDTLDGRFRVLTPDGRIDCVVLPSAELELWKKGEDHKRIVETGYVPVGRVNRVLEAGSYFLILDNQGSPNDQQIAADFAIE